MHESPMVHVVTEVTGIGNVARRVNASDCPMSNATAA